jgi:hypothetical protein
MQPQRSLVKTTLFASVSIVSMGWLLKMPQACSASEQEEHHA